MLLALAEELGKNFEEYVGGPKLAHVLLGPVLTAVEKTLVRDKVNSSSRAYSYIYISTSLLDAS